MKAELLIDDRYAKEHYNKWGTEQALKDGLDSHCYMLDILRHQDWNMRDKNGNNHHEFMELPGFVKFPEQSWFDCYLPEPDAKALLKKYFDWAVKQVVNGNSTHIPWSGIIYKTAAGKWEFYAGDQTFWTLEGNFENPRKGEYDYICHIMEAKGYCRWVEE